MQPLIDRLVAHEAGSQRPIRLRDAPPVFQYKDILDPSNRHIIVNKPFQSGGSNALLAAVLRARHHNEQHGDDQLVLVITDKKATASDARQKLFQDLTSMDVLEDIELHPTDVSKVFLQTFFETSFYDHPIHVFFAQGDVHGLGRLSDLVEKNANLEVSAHVSCVIDECDAHVRSSGSKRHKLDHTRLLEVDLFDKIFPKCDVVVAISATTMAYTDRCDHHGITYIETEGRPDARFYHGLDAVELLVTADGDPLVLPSDTVANLERQMASEDSSTREVVETFMRDFDAAPWGMCIDLSCINTNAAYNQYEHAERLLSMSRRKPAVLILNGDGLRLYDPGAPVTKSSGRVFTGSTSEAIECLARVHTHILCISHVCGERGQSWVSSTRVPTHGIVFPGNRDTSQLGQSMARLCFTRRHLLGGRTVKVLCTATDFEERNTVSMGMRESTRDIYRAKYLAEACSASDTLGRLGIPHDFVDNLTEREVFFFERLLVPSSQHYACLHATILRKFASVDEDMDALPLKKVQRIVRQIPEWYSEQREKNIPKYAFTKFNPNQAPAEDKEDVVYRTMMQKSSQADYWSIHAAKGLVFNRAIHALCQKLKPFGGLPELMQKANRL